VNRQHKDRDSQVFRKLYKVCEISSSHGGEYEVHDEFKFKMMEARAASIIIALMMEAARISETSVDNYFTRQYIQEDKSELDTKFVHRVLEYTYISETLRGIFHIP
jgi:hypothetical protein